MNNPPKILVVGDAMLDNYYFATTTRISPEAPIPVFKVSETLTLDGGARNVYTNLKALGADVKLVSGNTRVNSINPCPVKNRLMSGTTQVARWDVNDTLPPIDLEELDRAILHWTPDAIVVSDYGKGSITPDVLNWLAALNIAIYVDTKRDPKDYQRFNYITFFPNQKEYAEYDYCYNMVIYKRGAAGIQQLRYGNIVAEFPAYARNVVSVCGAGDVVIANYAYATALGRPDALFRSSIAAAIAVEKPFTATVTNEEIDERIKTLAS